MQNFHHHVSISTHCKLLSECRVVNGMGHKRKFDPTPQQLGSPVVSSAVPLTTRRISRTGTVSYYNVSMPMQCIIQSTIWNGDM